MNLKDIKDIAERECGKKVDIRSLMNLVDALTVIYPKGLVMPLEEPYLSQLEGECDSEKIPFYKVSCNSFIVAESYSTLYKTIK